MPDIIQNADKYAIDAAAAAGYATSVRVEIDDNTLYGLQGETDIKRLDIVDHAARTYNRVIQTKTTPKRRGAAPCSLTNKQYIELVSFTNNTLIEYEKSESGLPDNWTDLVWAKGQELGIKDIKTTLEAWLRSVELSTQVLHAKLTDYERSRAFPWTVKTDEPKHIPPLRRGLDMFFHNAGINKLLTTDLTQATLDKFTNEGTMIDPESRLKFFITDFSSFEGWKESTRALYVTLMTEALKQQTPVLSLKCSDILKLGGKKYDTNAARRIDEDLNIIASTALMYTPDEKPTKETHSYIPPYIRLQIVDAHRIEQGGRLCFSFAPTFYSVMQKSPVTYIPLPALWQLDFNKNRNSATLLIQLAYTDSIARKKQRPYIHTVKNLLACCPNIPSYEEVMATDRKVGKRIIDALEKSLDAIQETGAFSWEYCEKNGEPLQAAGFDNYKDFAAARVLIHWHDMPELPEKQAPGKTAKRHKNRA